MQRTWPCRHCQRFQVLQPAKYLYPVQTPAMILEISGRFQAGNLLPIFIWNVVASEQTLGQLTFLQCGWSQQLHEWAVIPGYCWTAIMHSMRKMREDASHICKAVLCPAAQAARRGTGI